MEDIEETLLEKEKERKSKVKADLPLNDNEYNRYVLIQLIYYLLPNIL